MKTVIRADSSTTIGTGHLMRCLTLADYLRNQGTDVEFIARELPGNICDYIEERKYRLHRLPFDEDLLQDKYESEYTRWLVVSQAVDADQTLSVLLEKIGVVDWLVVDHYGLDYRWQRKLRSYVNRIMVIDDLANRRHDCDLLLDQNLHDNPDSRYDGLVSNYCMKLLGPRFALLRPEFIQARENMPKRNGIVNRILVFFGGSDISNETAKALKAIKSIDLSQIAIDVVIGSSNPHKSNIEAISRGMQNVTLYHQALNMAQLMVKADLAIGGGGTTTWERCYLGLPAIIVAIAENQIEIGRMSERAGVASYLGISKNVSDEDISKEIIKLMEHPDELREMGKRGVKQVDGQGALRVCAQLIQNARAGVAI